jgi:hypothetical protein
MRHELVAFLLAAVLIAPALAAQNDERTPTLTGLPGLRLSSVPEVVYAQLPHVPRGQGLVVQHVGADAAANLWQLQKHDVVLSLDGQPLHDIAQFKRLLALTKPEGKVTLVVLRGGKEMTIELVLLGAAPTNGNVKSAVKPGGPPSVAIECTFLEAAKMQIKLEYYSEASSKLETVTCSGSLPEIEQKVREQRLPIRVQELVDVALKRLRTAKPR